MPGRRSDPKKLAADREAIRQSIDSFARVERVKRSRAKAQADADAFKKTGEGTMGEALDNLLGEAAERRRAKKFGARPEIRGSAVTGFSKGNTTI